jgi:hypothetical protein
MYYNGSLKGIDLFITLGEVAGLYLFLIICPERCLYLFIIIRQYRVISFSILGPDNLFCLLNIILHKEALFINYNRIGWIELFIYYNGTGFEHLFICNMTGSVSLYTYYMLQVNVLICLL